MALTPTICSGTCVTSRLYFIVQELIFHAVDMGATCPWLPAFLLDDDLSNVLRMGRSPLASDAAETRRTLEFCVRLAAARAGSPARQLDSAPTSPATGTVAGLAANFGGSTPRLSTRVYSAAICMNV